MKRIKYILCAALSAVLTGVFAAPALSVSAEEAVSSTDWMPFNYVLSEGFGSSRKLLEIRTDLDYSGGKLTVSGRTSKGGVGVVYLPEITLDGFNMNITVNSWQEVSPDRWFGMSLTDVGAVTDDDNELPFYAKHSESWANEYGAGTLFAFRPNGNGAMQIQFNYIGINGSYDADNNRAANAGEYNDGYLGWCGWLGHIQLYNRDWTVKTDYENIDITVKALAEGGYAFDINGGYWRRTDAVAWNDLAPDVLAELGVSTHAELTDEVKDKFMFGPAYETSIIPYANWGDDYYALYKYEQRLKAAGKRLYMRFMYKDAWDIREGTADASFTVNSINGRSATDGTDPLLTKENKIEGKLSATLKSENLHAGVYPSKVASLVTADVPEKNYSQAKTAVDAYKTRKVFCVKGKTADGKEISLISATTVKFDFSEYNNAKLYKIVGSDLDLVGEGASVEVKVNSSQTNYVLVYDAAKKGCKGEMGTVSLIGMLVLAAGAVFAAKKH